MSLADCPDLQAPGARLPSWQEVREKYPHFIRPAPHHMRHRLFITHRWDEKAHPDPRGWQLAALRDMGKHYRFREEPACIWYDYMSLPQRPHTPEEKKLFSAGLDSIRATVSECENVTLVSADGPGQALRYHVRRDGKQSLGDKSLVNLEVVHASLKALQSILEEFGFRAEMLVDERRSGTCTAVCSRSDLFAITARLPQRADWNSEAFDTARAAIREEFGLSSQQFQQALNVIQRHPQMGAMLGMEFELAHLSDEHAIFAAQLSRTLHPRLADIRRRGQVIIAPQKRSLKEIQQNQAALDAAVSQLVERLSADALADLETLYQMGRASAWPETYADRLADTKAEHALQPSPGEFPAYLLGKGNLVEAVSVSVAQLGRPRLAEVLRSL